MSATAAAITLGTVLELDERCVYSLERGGATADKGTGCT